MKSRISIVVSARHCVLSRTGVMTWQSKVAIIVVIAALQWAVHRGWIVYKRKCNVFAV